MEYYVNSNTDPDYQGNEYLYEDVITDAMVVAMPQVVGGSTSDEEKDPADGSESVSSAPAASVTSPPGTPGGLRTSGSGSQSNNHSSRQDDSRKRTKSESTAQDEVQQGYMHLIEIFLISLNKPILNEMN